MTEYFVLDRNGEFVARARTIEEALWLLKREPQAWEVVAERSGAVMARRDRAA